MALWAYGPAGDIRQWGQTLAYETGDRTLAFQHCAVCGCLVHWISLTDAGPATRIAVNTRLAPVEEIAGIEVNWFDGADSWTSVDGPFPPA